MFIIYKATSPKHKCYVGYTSESLEERKRKHFVEVKMHGKWAFKRCLLKYGDSIKWEILEQGMMTLEEAHKKERKYIAELNTKAPDGYNLTDGGEGMKGFVYTEKMRAKMSEAHKGYIMPQTQKDRIGKSLKNSTIHKIHNEGHSEESNKSNSETHKALHKNPTYRQKFMASRNKMKKEIIDQFGNIYPSLGNAAEVLGISKGNISNVITGRIRQTNGYIFRTTQHNNK